MNTSVNLPVPPLLSHLVERGLLAEKSMQIALQEHNVTHEDYTMILVRNGFIRQADLTRAILDINPELLYNDYAFLPNIPASLLLDTRTVIFGHTPETIYLSTLGLEEIVASEIAQYDTRKLVFMPTSLDKMDTYLDELSHLESDEAGSFVDRLIRRALRDGSSDLHIIPREKSYTILQRRLGVRELMHEGDLDEYHVLVARIKDRASMDMSERRRPQDGKFQVEHEKKMIDLRVATTPHVMGEYMVVRLLDPDSVQMDLSELGITRVDEWQKGINRSFGLCLICGPTGSGKSTTLTSSLREVDRIEKSVFTVEDPVEYMTPFVAQVNVNEAVGLDFTRAQKAFMRQDPDIIVTGEIRDEETARISIKGAETGHIMIATLHTSSIAGTVTRLRDLGIAANEVRHILRTVLVQRLVRTVCKVCQGETCASCHHTGYGGRTTVSECTYFPDEKAVDAMLEGKIAWPTMIEDAVDKVEAGITTEAEIIRVFGPEAEEALLKRKTQNANPSLKRLAAEGV